MSKGNQTQNQNQTQANVNDELMKELAKLKAENETLKKATLNNIRLKVSEKGCVSMYGLGKFPVTLYANQWEKVFAMKEQVSAFVEANRSDLSFTKTKPVEAVAAEN